MAHGAVLRAVGGGSTPGAGATSARTRRGARLVRAIEHPAGLIVQRLPPGATDTGVTTELARWKAVQALQPLPGGGRRHPPPPTRRR